MYNLSMLYYTLISTRALQELLDNHNRDRKCVIVDCRFSLLDPQRARQDYLEAHIPGAVLADLDRDLSGPVVKGVTGRHPLPHPQVFAEVLSQWGIRPGVQVVVYDGAGGSLAAARLWWMLRWMGQVQAAVLDGGWQKWLLDGGQTVSGEEKNPYAQFAGQHHPEKIIQVDELTHLLARSDHRVIDSRSTDRYHGENETIDPVGGHIPGAVNLPYALNLNPDNTFRPVKELRERFQPVMGERSAGNMVFYCGSGVTAAHNILAMLHAGLGEARLYVGSWSEWINDPQRPVEV